MLTRYLPLTCLFISLAIGVAYSQDTNTPADTVKKDTSTADTAAIKALKEFPKKDLLPVRTPVIQLQPVQVPKSSLNLKVNYWKTWVSFGLNVNQASFSDNWSGGGVNSLALGSMFNFKTDYTKGDKNFVSEIIMQYGRLKNKDQLERKTNDRIFWDNKVALKLSKSWYFFGSVNFESQFDEGFNYARNDQGQETRTLISRFMSPGYVTESIGFEYKPGKVFWLRIGTGTARQTLVLDTSIIRTNPKNYGVEPGRRFRNELAFQLVTSIDKDISPNLNLKSRYMLFANYERLNNIDNRLDLTITAKITKLINVTLAGVALYDDDTDNEIQSSQALSFGLMYKFPK